MNPEETSPSPTQSTETQPPDAPPPSSETPPPQSNAEPENSPARAMVRDGFGVDVVRPNNVSRAQWRYAGKKMREKRRERSAKRERQKPAKLARSR